MYDYWDEITHEFIKNEEATIGFFLSCEDQNIIDTVSSSFVDTAYKLQSRRFVQCLEDLVIKFPNSHIKHMVEVAKNMM